MKTLPDQPLCAAELKRLGINRRALQHLIKNGYVERVARGIYRRTLRTAELEEDRYAVAIASCGQPSSICLISALEHYHLTDQIAKKIWVLVPASKRSGVKELRLFRSRNPHWNVGINKTAGYWITSLERTLVDCLVHRRIVGSQIALEALKRALTRKQVKLTAVIDVARAMKVDHRVLPYLEAFAL